MSDYWLSEAARLQSQNDHLAAECEVLRSDHALMKAVLQSIITDHYPLSPERVMAAGRIKEQRDRWRAWVQECAGKLRYLP